MPVRTKTKLNALRTHTHTRTHRDLYAKSNTDRRAGRAVCGTCAPKSMQHKLKILVKQKLIRPADHFHLLSSDDAGKIYIKT